MTIEIYNKTSIEVFNELKLTENSYLVDVRSDQEHDTKGVVDLSETSCEVIYCEWPISQKTNKNQDFSERLFQRIDLDDVTTLYFLCAAGVRSHEAAKQARSKMKDLGHRIDFVNVSDGFEGTVTNIFNFGQRNGWKQSGLPWCWFDKFATGERA